MEQWEQATPAQQQSEMRQAVCWECGREVECYEYIVCCTGTMFHVCPTCQKQANAAVSASLSEMADPAVVPNNL